MSYIHPSTVTTTEPVDILNDPMLFKLYQMSMQRNYRNDMIVPFVVVAYLALITRFNLKGGLQMEGPIFTASFVFLVIGSCTFFPYLVTRLVVHHTPSNRTDTSYYRKSVKFQKLANRLHFQSVMCFLAVNANGLILLGRVFAGACAGDISIWTDQTCNPFAEVASIPPDQVMLVYLTPLVTQLIRGILVNILLIAWLMGLAYVSIASWHVGGFQQLWTLTYSVFFMVTILMTEEMSRVTFIQGQAMIAASAASLKQELVLMEMTAIVEKKLKENEVQQLKSLMGNVAHDLKTPLHNIEADLEMIRTFISKIPTPVLDIAHKELRVNLTKDNIDVMSILNSLKATCKFMGMSINRSQDFMKSSNNIALVPLMETFELRSALDMSVTCLDHLDSGKSITLRPLSADICPQVISDKHWITENTLCLLSNAVKYSDDGCIDVRMKLIDVPIQNVISPPLSAPRIGTDCESKDERRASLTTKTSDGDNVYITIPSMTTASTPNTDQSLTPPRSPLDIGMVGTRTIDKGSGLRSGNESGSGSETKQMLMISVEDNGIGIPEEKHSQLFQPFAQAQRMAGGTGSGLYSLAKRMEALGGECGVSGQSDGGQGSMFWFTFPYRPDASRRDDVVEESSLLALPADFVKPKHILIIDDSWSILKVTARMLTMNGHTVTTATNGSIGLKMMKQAYITQEYDMVLTDIQMPVMDGIEATRRYREFEAVEMELEKKEGTRNSNRVEKVKNGSNKTSLWSATNSHDNINTDDANKTKTNVTNPIGNNDNNSDSYNNSTNSCHDDDDDVTNCVTSHSSKVDRKKLIIIGMSANSDSLTQQEALDCGMDHFLAKPFAYNNLLPIFKQLHANSSSGGASGRSCGGGNNGSGAGVADG